MTGSPPRERPTQELPGKRARVLAVAEQDLAVDDRRRDPARALHEPAGAGGEIVDDLRQLRADRVGVEDDQIGREALADEAAVGEAPVRRGYERQHAHRLLERERLLRAHPVAQEVCLERRVDDLRDVGAGVGERHDRARMSHHLEHGVLIFVGDRVDEETLEVPLEREVDHRLGRIDTALARDLGHRTVRARDVVVEEDPLVGERPRFGPEGPALGRFVGALDQTTPRLGVAQALSLLGQRQRAERLPRREVVERQLALERQHDVEPAAVHLGEHPPARGRGLVEQLHVTAPHRGRLQAAEHAPRDGPPGLDREVAQAHVIVAEAGEIAELAADGLAGQLEDPGVHLAHHADEPPDLAPRRQPAGDRPAIGRFVDRRARGREAHRAGADRVAELALHRAKVVLRRRLLERALAHHVGAEGAVAEVARVVDALGQGVETVEPLRKRRPPPLDARLHRLERDVLGTLEVPDDEVLVGRGARGERKSTVAHHHGRDTVPARAGAERVPEDLRVHVRVAVDETGCDDQAVGVDDLAGALANLTDRGDPAVADGDVGVIAGQTGAIDQHAVLDDEVVGHRPFLPARVSARGRRGTLSYFGRTRYSRVSLHEEKERYMTKKKGTGLLMVWTDVPADKEEEFNRWYNEEHLAERLSVPGFLSAARYEAVKGGPKHLACYELESVAVLESGAYNRVRAHPTEWTRRCSPEVIGANYIRNIYALIHPKTVTPEVAQSDMAPALQIGRMDVPPEIDDQFNAWYNTIYVPNYEKVPGVIRGRRYRAVTGTPTYLTLYEFEHSRVSESAAWAAQRDISPVTHRIRPHMRHAPGSPGIWVKTFQL